MKLLKLLLSITLIYILLAFGIETAFIALMCVIASIVLILAIGVRRSATSVRDSFYSVDPNEHYYWTPGQPAICLDLLRYALIIDALEIEES